MTTFQGFPLKLRQGLKPRNHNLISICGQAPYEAPGLRKLLLDVKNATVPERCPFLEAELRSPFESIRGSKRLNMPSSLKALLELPD